MQIDRKGLEIQSDRAHGAKKQIEKNRHRSCPRICKKNLSRCNMLNARPNNNWYIMITSQLSMKRWKVERQAIVNARPI